MLCDYLRSTNGMRALKQGSPAKEACLLVLAFGFKLDDDVDEFGGFRDDDFADFAVGGEFLDVGVGEGESLELVGIREEVRGDGEFCAEFAIDLDDDFDGVGGEGGFVPGRPDIVATEFFEHLGGKVRRKRLQELRESNLVLVERGGEDIIDELHERGDRGVEAAAMNIFGDFLDGFVTEGLAGSEIISGEVGSIFFGVEDNGPAAIQEAIDSADSFGVPGGVLVVGVDEHFVSAESVGAVAALDNFEWVDDIAFRLGHFLAVGGVDVAVVEELLDRLAERQIALVGEELTPEANIEKMSNGVIATDIDVGRYQYLMASGSQAAWSSCGLT